MKHIKLFEEFVNEFGPLAGSGNSRANDLDNIKRDASRKSERGETIYVVGGKGGRYKLSKYFEDGNTYAAYYNGMPQELDENLVNEDLGIIDIAIGAAVGVAGLWALVQGLPVVGRVLGDAAEALANGVEKKAKEAARGQRKELIGEIIKKFDGDVRLKQMYNDLPPYTDKAASARKRQLTTIGNYIKSKLTEEEMAYFRDISAMLRTGDLKESVLNEEITLNSPSFKKLVTKIQEISDDSKNDWDALKTYLRGKYAFFETYSRGTNPAAYVVNFFSITKGKDEYVKKNPQNYVQIGDWYIRPW